MRAHLSEVCEPEFWTGDVKLLALSTHNECSNAVSTVRSISREPSYNMHHLETTPWVVWTRLSAGDMKLLNLLTHDRCGQLVSIVSSISIKNLMKYMTCGHNTVRCVNLTLSRHYEGTWCMWQPGEIGEVCEPDFEHKILFNWHYEHNMGEDN